MELLSVFEALSLLDRVQQQRVEVLKIFLQASVQLRLVEQILSIMDRAQQRLVVDRAQESLVSVFKAVSQDRVQQLHVEVFQAISQDRFQLQLVCGGLQGVLPGPLSHPVLSMFSALEGSKRWEYRGEVWYETLDEESDRPHFERPQDTLAKWKLPWA